MKSIPAYRSRRTRRRIFLMALLPLSAASLLFSGCTVGPNYHRPDAPTAPAFKETAAPVEGGSR
jgi:uncharacterized lipoprotein YajG